MPPPKRVLAVGIVFAVIVSIALRGALAADEAASTLELAENSLASSYGAVFDAGKAGANVTALTRELDNAGFLLSKAYLEYRVGNLSGSIYFAELSHNVSSETMLRAMQLKEIAASEAARRFWLTVITSSASIIVIILMSYILWQRFRRWYQSRSRVLVR